LKIIGLDDREYSWSPSRSEASTEKRSSLHLKARTLLAELYPYDIIVEEVSLPGTKALRADFFIPTRGIVIEVHGEQHFKFNSFFFSSKLDFYKAKARDRDKKTWCELNSFTLVEFNYNESVEDWKGKLWKS
jgi:hypothetical protein